MANKTKTNVDFNEDQFICFHHMVAQVKTGIG